MRAVLILAVAAVGLTATGASAQTDRASHDCTRVGGLHFRAADGTRLHGHRFGKGTTAVVLAHQSDGTLCQWAPYARRLASLGYLALAFDFRGSGRSQRRSGPAALRFPADVIAAAKLVRKLGAKKVFLVGASMGGTAALVAAAGTQPPVTGVVAISSPSYYPRMDAEAAVPRLRAPVLYLAAENDQGYADAMRDLFAKTASTDKAIEILPGSAHGVSLIASSARARALVEAFLRSH